MLKNILPWQEEAWGKLVILKDKLPGSLLFTGKKGIGKFQFAKTFAQFLLCEMPTLPNYLPCERCNSCIWFKQEYHPDFKLIEPQTNNLESAEEASRIRKQITIDQVRELEDFIHTTSHRSGLRIILIYPAETLNVNAANALLKSLEESRPGVSFILVSHQPHRLLATVISRCYKFPLKAPQPNNVISWLTAQGIETSANSLALYSGTPLEFMVHAQPDSQKNHRFLINQLAKPQLLDVINLSHFCQKLELSLVLGWIQKWIYDLIAWRISKKVNYHIDFKEQLEQAAHFYKFNDLLNSYNRLIELQKTAVYSLNAKLLLESIFLDLSRFRID